ncbi:MAG: Flp pilus assembly protein CpaB [Alphaproteobacteria bacterium]
MNARVIVLVVAFVAALGTVFLVKKWMDAQQATLAQQPTVPVEVAGTQVLVAKEDLPAGTLLKPEHLRWQAWPDEAMAQSYIVKGARELTEFEGAVVRSVINAGQPITDAQVVKPGERGFLAAVVMPGKRAISVSVNATTGISGFVFPGDRVDVILTHTIKEEAGSDENDKVVRRASETVLTNIRVIAVDQTTNDQSSEPTVAKNVTLEVTPREAEVLSLVSELGKLSLSLRSIVLLDGKDGKDQSATVAQRTFTWDSDASILLTPPHPRVANGFQVNIVRGPKAETQEFRRTQ